MLCMSPLATLLTAEDPPPFRVIEAASASPFLITCDHAGNVLPKALGSLGLSESELQTHIAWDIGAAGVTERLALELGAYAILQTYSRLAIDCNRPLHVESSIAENSEYARIAGNIGISHEQAELRTNEIFRPYHRCIEAELDRRVRAGCPTWFIALHSFTPRFMGTARQWHAGILYNRDARLAHVLLELLRREEALLVGDNQPYQVSDLSDYGVVEYGERRGLLHVELEIRQDLIADPAGQAEWAARLARVLREAYALLAGS